MAGNIQWFRWHHGSVTDPKFKLIAHKAKQSLATVIAVWAFVLEQASANGASISTFDPAGCDALLGLDKGQSDRILSELSSRGFISDGRISNPRHYFPSPSMRPSGGAWTLIREFIFKRDNYTCQYCGSRGGRIECDHKTPVADGGLHTPENLTTACFTCNRKKGSKSLEEWRNIHGW